MNDAVWLPVVGYEDLYEVSDDGRVRSLGRTDSRGRQWKPRILAGTRQSGGYLGLVLRRDGIGVNYRLHVLVAEAFLGPRPEGQVVRHLNGDPTDNRLPNLAYGTTGANALDRVRHDETRRRAEAAGVLFLDSAVSRASVSAPA